MSFILTLLNSSHLILYFLIYSKLIYDRFVAIFNISVFDPISRGELKIHDGTQMRVENGPSPTPRVLHAMSH